MLYEYGRNNGSQYILTVCDQSQNMIAQSNIINIAATDSIATTNHTYNCSCSDYVGIGTDEFIRKDPVYDKQENNTNPETNLDIDERNGINCENNEVIHASTMSSE